jgi:hypothetical protein
LVDNLYIFLLKYLSLFGPMKKVYVEQILI